MVGRPSSSQCGWSAPTSPRGRHPRSRHDVTVPIEPPRRGRGLVTAGAIMRGLSIVGGVVGTAVLTSRMDLRSLERDVVVDGPRERLVPGEIRFRVVEPLGDSRPEEMTVGIALDDTSGPRPECTIEAADGEEAPRGRARVGDELFHGRPGYRVVGTARLGPGDYVAKCGAGDGEPSRAREYSSNFTVGRVVGVDDLSPMVAPLFGLFAVWLLSGLLFVVGLVLLIIGLVQRSRSRRAPVPQWGGPPQQVPPGGGPPPGHGPPPGYGPPPIYGPPPTQPPPSGPPTPPAGHEPPGSWGPAPSGPPTLPEPSWTPSDGSWTPPPEPEREAPPEPEGSAPREEPPSGWTIPPSKRQT